MESEKYITRSDEACSYGLRDLIRGLSLSTLANLYELTGQMGSERNRVQILYLHHIFEDEEDSFRRLLDTLRREYHFIAYSEAVERILNGNIDSRYIAITFDDGLKTCLRAAQIMDEYCIKACFFLCASIIGESNYQKIKQFCSQRLHMAPMEFLSWGDLELLLKKGHEIGSHTMTHADLARIPLAQAQQEITESFRILFHRVGKIKHFAWPFGRFVNLSPRLVKIAFEAGFESCASAIRGCHVVPVNKFNLCIRRDHIVAKWPIGHIHYFLARNCRNASIPNSLWPASWLPHLS